MPNIFKNMYKAGVFGGGGWGSLVTLTVVWDN